MTRGEMLVAWEANRSLKFRCREWGPEFKDGVLYFGRERPWFKSMHCLERADDILWTYDDGWEIVESEIKTVTTESDACVMCRGNPIELKPCSFNLSIECDAYIDKAGKYNIIKRKDIAAAMEGMAKDRQVILGTAKLSFENAPIDFFEQGRLTT